MQNEGIPESVTADLDELEREGVVSENMSEMTALFDNIEDELLGNFFSFYNSYLSFFGILVLTVVSSCFLVEMGASFNILEYADPELDNFTPGETTNILYDLVNSTSDSTKIK